MPSKKPRSSIIFNDRYPLIGPLFYVLSIQYYLIQVWVASIWKTPFSWLHNTISDLGNTACASYDHRFVCSPQHSLMDASFVILGITMIVGSMLIYREFKRTFASRLGFICMALAGLGTIFVGLFPENTVSILHESGAALPFSLGNLAMIILGLALALPKWLRIYTVLSGLVGLIALPLFLTHRYLGLDIGGMERIVAYPQSIWLMAFGLYMWRTQYRQRR